MKSTFVTCAVLLALACFYGTEAIKCYEGIGDAKETMDGCTHCAKASTSVAASESVRSCYVNITCVESHVNLPGVGDAGLYCCDTDLCNGASTVYISSIMSLLGVLLFTARRML